ncbi:MAG: MFS transporter [Bryobacteraceae bacterium]
MATSTADPRDIIDQSQMTMAQIVVVTLTVLLNAMDGFDVLSIAFASPGIAAEWGIDRAALGIVLSMELIGMAIGSIFLGGVADKIGRRPTLLGCLVVMAIGMLGATSASSPVILSAWRVFTGLGIGGMLSATNAVVGEFTSKKSRALCISIMVIGYPLGAGFGGLYASSLIGPYGWRAVFYLGATATGLLLPLLYFTVPESVHWLTRKQPEGALGKVNASLSKLGLPTVSSLPVITADEKKKSIGDIFSPALISTTLLVTATYFLHILTFYFLVKWTPQILTMMKFSPAGAGQVLALANLGGAAGGAVFGILTARFGLKPLTVTILLLNSIAVAAFGRSPQDLTTLTWLAIIVGFCGNAAISGLYSIVAYAFPTHVKATGTGFVVGVGRGGAVLSPILAGYLLEAEMGLPTVALIMGVGSLLAGGVLMFLKMGGEQPKLNSAKA